MIPPHLSFRRLKRCVSIEQVLADKGLLARLRRRGACWVGPCPIHRGDNVNAFAVNPAKNIWRCFTGCDAGGDVVELVRRLGDGSYKHAASYLATLADGATPKQSSVPAPPRARSFRPFTRCLPLDPTAPFLKQKRIQPSTARRFDVGAFYGSGMLAGCVAVRLFDPQGRPLGYAGRRLEPEQVSRYGKWRFPTGLRRNTLLYGYHQAPRLSQSGTVLVECPWGVLRFAQLGIPAVALLGTHLSPTQQTLLADLPMVVVMMDGDKAGQSAARTIRRLLPRTTVIDLPNGLDPDDLTDDELTKAKTYLLL
jgi:DNA primase